VLDHLSHLDIGEVRHCCTDTKELAWTDCIHCRRWPFNCLDSGNTKLGETEWLSAVARSAEGISTVAFLMFLAHHQLIHLLRQARFSTSSSHSIPSPTVKMRITSFSAFLAAVALCTVAEAVCPTGTLIPVPSLAQCEAAVFKLSTDCASDPGGPGCICDTRLATVACLKNCLGVLGTPLRQALAAADRACTGLPCRRVFGQCYETRALAEGLTI
jgi:hypothetical protein